jgi:hypothetical protein
LALAVSLHPDFRSTESVCWGLIKLGLIFVAFGLKILQRGCPILFFYAKRLAHTNKFLLQKVAQILKAEVVLVFWLKPFINAIHNCVVEFLLTQVAIGFSDVDRASNQCSKVKARVCVLNDEALLVKVGIAFKNQVS